MRILAVMALLVSIFLVACGPIDNTQALGTASAAVNSTSAAVKAAQDQIAALQARNAEILKQVEDLKNLRVQDDPAYKALQAQLTTRPADSDLLKQIEDLKAAKVASDTAYKTLAKENEINQSAVKTLQGVVDKGLPVIQAGQKLMADLAASNGDAGKQVTAIGTATAAGVSLIPVYGPIAAAITGIITAIASAIVAARKSKEATAAQGQANTLQAQATAIVQSIEAAKAAGLSLTTQQIAIIDAVQQGTAGTKQLVNEVQAKSSTQ